MVQLLHHKLDPASRLVRLMAFEYGVALELNEVSHWKRTPEFLEISPAGTLPVFMEPQTPAIVGVTAIIHCLEERYAPSTVSGLIPADPKTRYEMWRLVEWVIVKLAGEVTNYVLEEKISKHETRQGTPDTSILRAAKANLTEHLKYFDWLLSSRSWLAGGEMSLADFALASYLSCLDYLGDIGWDAHPDTKDWYARMKSRPSFRPLLADKLMGTPPIGHYADLDF